MQNLLDEIGAIDAKYKELKEQNRFNIFSILRSNSDEVNLHSRFIAEILNPKGAHQQGNVFLNHFLHLCNLEPADYAEAWVKREYNNIDILIRCGSKAIIIENKIWAADQERQLERYHNTMLAEGATEIKVIYLTLDGRDPDDPSRGVLEKESIHLMSYRYDILQWLDQCFEEVPGLPVLRETILQYKHLVGELTGNSMSDKEKSEVIEVLKENGNIIKAAKIAESWSHIKLHTEWNFWKALKEAVASEYTILPAREVSWKKVKYVAERRRKGNPWYGIMVQLAKLDEDSICLFIQRGKGTLYYGITVLDKKEDRNISGTDKYTPLARRVSNLNDKREQRWVGKKFFSEPINFELFSGETTLKLIEPDFRQKYVSSLWSEIRNYIAACDINGISEEPQVMSNNM